MKDLNKHLVGSMRGFKIYTVNEEAIRNAALKYADFTNYAVYEDYPDLIGKNEVWVSEEVDPSDLLIFKDVGSLRAQYFKDGFSKNEVYDKVLKVEKLAREKQRLADHHPSKIDKRAKEELYVKKIGTLTNGADIVAVWLINTPEVQQYFKTDFVEGGHGYVYPWIPNNEIWIDRELKPDEYDYILMHEYYERTLMKDLKMKYLKAHDLASENEYAARKRGKVRWPKGLYKKNESASGFEPLTEVPSSEKVATTPSGIREFK